MVQTMGRKSSPAGIQSPRETRRTSGFFMPAVSFSSDWTNAAGDPSGDCRSGSRRRPGGRIRRGIPSIRMRDPLHCAVPQGRCRECPDAPPDGRAPPVSRRAWPAGGRSRGSPGWKGGRRPSCPGRAAAFLSSGAGQAISSLGVSLMTGAHRFQGPLEGQAEQEGGGHPVAVQTADPAVRSPSVRIDPAGTLHAPVGAGEPQAQETVLRLLFFIPFPVEADPLLGRPAEQVLAHRVDCLEMNRFHKIFQLPDFQIWLVGVSPTHQCISCFS